MAPGVSGSARFDRAHSGPCAGGRQRPRSVPHQRFLPFTTLELIAPRAARSRSSASSGPRRVPEKNRDDHKRVEAPVRNRVGNYLLFSDIPNNAVYKRQAGKSVSLLLQPGGYSGRKPFAGNPSIDPLPYSRILVTVPDTVPGVSCCPFDKVPESGGPIYRVDDQVNSSR